MFLINLGYVIVLIAASTLIAPLFHTGWSDWVTVPLTILAYTVALTIADVARDQVIKKFNPEG